MGVDHLSSVVDLHRVWVGHVCSKLTLPCSQPQRAQDMLDLEERNLRMLGDEKMHYLSYPPSLAVDGKPDTAFRSLLSIAISFSFDVAFLNAEQVPLKAIP